MPLPSTPFWLPAFQESLEGGPPWEAPARVPEATWGQGGLSTLGPAGFWPPQGWGQLAWPLLARLLAFLVLALGPGWGWPLEDWMFSLCFS